VKGGGSGSPFFNSGNRNDDSTPNETPDDQKRSLGSIFSDMFSRMLSGRGNDSGRDPITLHYSSGGQSGDENSSLLDIVSGGARSSAE
jgi:hypothetical protein